MIVTADRVITGDGVTVIENGSVVLEGQKILAVGPTAQLKERYPGEEETVYEGCTLMPGMIDLHTHIGYYYGRPQEREFEENPMLHAYFVQKRMEETLKAGVTTIRDVSSANGIGVTLKKAASYGYIKAPRILTSLQGICMTGGHGYNMKGAVIEADGVEEVRKAVRRDIRDGADCIKILTSEAYRGEEFSKEEIQAAVKEAHRFGKRIAAHAGYGTSIGDCIDAGCDTIEHGTHLTVMQAEQMKAADQTWVPTIYVFNAAYNAVCQAGCEDELLNDNRAYLKDTVDTYRENFETLYRTGVRVATGTDTDCLNVDEASPVAGECAFFVEYGMPPVRAIECATANGAYALGLGDTLGQLKENYTADMIAVKGNPAEDITALCHVEAVYQAGRQTGFRQP